MNNESLHALAQDGYTILSGHAGPDLVRALSERIASLFESEGDRAGSEFKQETGATRLANLVDKDEVFRSVIADPVVLQAVRSVLGPAVKLSSLNARRAEPHNGVTQPLHCDMSALPDARGPWVCNTVWVLDDFSADNGALRVVPGSHRRGALPRDVLLDPAAPHPDEIVLTAASGSVIIINAHLWHGGLANSTSRPRTALHAFYCRRDKPQQQHQRALLSPQTQQSLSPELRDLLALDDSVNDQLSAEVAVRSGFMK
jgi:ectoine hydroxylase-related dioxygenase (phytanoyl-CoA dioxygenase family)